MASQRGRGHIVWLAALATVGVAVAGVAAGARATTPGKNGLIVFTGEVGKHTQLFTIEPDGAGMKQVTHLADGSDALNANWSPDGKTIVFERDFPYPHAGIFVVNADGSGLRSLTPNRKLVFESIPAFSPDGKRIIFGRQVCATAKCNGPHDGEALWTKRVNGSGARRVTAPIAPGPNDRYPDHPQLSPNGRRIVYVKRLGDQAAVFVVNANGRGEKQLTKFSMGVDDRVDWSPNGKLILFSDNYQFVDVYTIRPDGTGLKQLTHSTSGNYSGMSWSPDGKQILLVIGRPDLAHASLFVMNADGSGLHQVTRTLNVHGGAWGTHP